MKCLERLK
jgi:UDP-glucose 4-epimerase